MAEDKYIEVLVVTDQDSYDIPILVGMDHEKVMEAYRKWWEEAKDNPYWRQQHHTFRVRLVE